MLESASYCRLLYFVDEITAKGNKRLLKKHQSNDHTLNKILAVRFQNIFHPQQKFNPIIYFMTFQDFQDLLYSDDTSVLKNFVYSLRQFNACFHDLCNFALFRSALLNCFGPWTTCLLKKVRGSPCVAKLSPIEQRL